MNQIQLDLFPDHQTLVAIRLVNLNTCVRLNARGGRLEINSYWQTLDALITAFPVIAECVATMTLQDQLTTSVKLSEEEWEYWSVLGHWPDGTDFWGLVYAD